MPLIYYRSVEAGEVALWHATEKTSFFKAYLQEQNFPIEAARRINHPEKLHQWFASRYLLSKIYPEAIQLYRNRKPFLYNGPEVSFSHSKQYVALILSQFPSGIDVQIADPKLKTIAPKFVNPTEMDLIKAPTELMRLSIIWSVKEAVFKKFGTEMPFKNIRIESYNPISEHAIVTTVRKGVKSAHNVVVDYIEGMSLAYVIK